MDVRRRVTLPRALRPVKEQQVPIILKSRDEIAIMREAGRHVAEVLHLLVQAVKPGVPVIHLDKVVRQEFKRRGVTSPFLGYQPNWSVVPYPSTVCVSINDQIVHGIPGDRILKDGDIVSLDLGAVHRGFVGDAAVTVPCGEVSDEVEELLASTRHALNLAIEQVRAGNRLGDVGNVIFNEAERHGYGVVREYSGHGVGRSMHEEPSVPNYGTPGKGPLLRPGMVIAIEPMFNLGTHETRKDERDGWTIWTADGALSAHFEHTVAVTPDGPEVLTLP